MRQAPIDRIGSTPSKRLPTSGGSNMGETLRPADLWQRHLGEGPPRKGRMTWDECQSKLLALTAEVARSASTTSPEKVGDFLRTARASCQRPVEVRSRSGRLGNGHTVDLSVSGMRVSFAQPIDLRWHTVILLDPGDSLGPIVTRFALVREIVPSREYAIRFLDLYPQDVHRLSRLPAA